MKAADVENLVTLGLVAVGGYMLWKVLSGVSSAVSAGASTVYTGAQNFDQNIGLGPVDDAISSLFQPPVMQTN
jgi:hypothetical protein